MVFSVIGNILVAISASKASLVSQCLSFLCRLYLGPLFSKDSSFLEKVMSVLFPTLQKKVLGCLGVIVCCWASLCNLSLRVLYLDPFVLCSLSSIVS